jgi:ABC-type molybdate transport system permease subunit
MTLPAKTLTSVVLQQVLVLPPKSVDYNLLVHIGQSGVLCVRTRTSLLRIFLNLNTLKILAWLMYRVKQ